MGPLRLDHIESRRVLGWLISAWIVLGVVALDPSGFSPFGPVKWLVISSLLPLAAVFAFSGKVVMHRRAMTLWVLLLVWVVVSALLGVDKFHAWFGTPTRRFGVHAWLLCGLAFAVGQQVVLKRQGELVHKALIISGLALGAYGALEALDFAPVELAQFATRVGSTYGSPAYLGAASALLLPVLIGISTSFEDRWRTASYVAATGVLFVALASGTRAAWVGLAVAGVMMAAVGRRVLVLKPSLVLGAAIGGIAAMIATPVGSRVVDVFDFSQGTSRGRIDEWRVGIDAIIARPFSGAGPEGYRVVFAESVTENYAQTYGRGQIVDRAHNGLIDIAATIGVPGVVAIVILLAIVGRTVFAAFRSRDPVLVGTGAALLAYIVQQQFLFPLAEVDPLAWLLAGTLVIRVGEPHEFVSWSNRPEPLRWVLSGSLIALSTLALAFGTADVVANRWANTALNTVSTDMGAAEDLARRSGELRPDSVLYASVEAEVNRLARTENGLDAALTANSRGLRYSPRDPALLAGRGALLIARARLDGTLESAQAAVDHWLTLTNSDPNNGRFFLQLGVAHAGLGQESEAEAAWIRSSLLSPRSAEPNLNLGLLYSNQGRVGEAQQQLLKAVEIEPANPAIADLESAINGSS